jgi:hypothetical protein
MEALIDFTAIEIKQQGFSLLITVKSKLVLITR